jgi:hypothetical protein
MRCARAQSLGSLILTFAVLVAGWSASSCSTDVREPLAPTSKPVFDRLIVPGQRIGPVSYYMHVSELLNTLGDTDDTYSYHCKDTPNDVCSVRYKWPNGLEAEVSYRDDTHYYRVPRERVHSVSTHDPRYATADGVGVGVSELVVKAKLGKPVWEKRGDSGHDSHMCYEPGLFIWIWESKVNFVEVWPSKCGK